MEYEVSPDGEEVTFKLPTNTAHSVFLLLSEDLEQQAGRVLFSRREVMAEADRYADSSELTEQLQQMKEQALQLVDAAYGMYETATLMMCEALEKKRTSVLAAKA